MHGLRNGMKDRENETGGDMMKSGRGTRNGAKTLEKTGKNAVNTVKVGVKIMRNVKEKDVMT
jgi:hypothetical protein